MSLSPKNQAIMLALFLAALLIPSLSCAETTPFYGRIQSDNINLRSDSRLNSEAICTLNKGDTVEVVSQLYGEWYKVRLPESAPAFIKKDLLVCQPEVDTGKCKTAKVSGNSVNIRLQPNDSSPILGHVYKNEVVAIVDGADGWYKVEPPAQSFGWIHKKFVKKIDPDKTEESLRQGKEGVPKSLVLEGIVVPYGMVFNRKASHKLVTKEKKVYFLKGNKKNLDDFNHKRVRIIGRLVGLSTDKYPLVEIEKMEAAQ